MTGESQPLINTCFPRTTSLLPTHGHAEIGKLHKEYLYASGKGVHCWSYCNRRARLFLIISPQVKV